MCRAIAGLFACLWLLLKRRHNGSASAGAGSSLTVFLKLTRQLEGLRASLTDLESAAEEVEAGYRTFAKEEVGMAEEHVADRIQAKACASDVQTRASRLSYRSVR